MGVVATDEFSEWYGDPENGLKEADIEAVTAAIDVLEIAGVALGFPRSSDLKGSRHALRELRIQSHGKPIRIAYAFDPARDAVVLIGGYKSADKDFYGWFVPCADKIFDEYIEENASKWTKKASSKKKAKKKP